MPTPCTRTVPELSTSIRDAQRPRGRPPLAATSGAWRRLSDGSCRAQGREHDISVRKRLVTRNGERSCYMLSGLYLKTIGHQG